MQGCQGCSIVVEFSVFLQRCQLDVAFMRFGKLTTHFVRTWRCSFCLSKCTQHKNESVRYELIDSFTQQAAVVHTKRFAITRNKSVC